MVEDGEEPEKKETRPIYILTPDGMLSEVTSKASILKSLLEEYKIDSSIFKDILSSEIEDVKEQLEDELRENDKSGK